MMKKYYKPEIVTLALDMVDVIETSAEVAGYEALKAAGVVESNITTIEKQVTDMHDNWSW